MKEYVESKQNNFQNYVVNAFLYSTQKKLNLVFNV